MPIEFGVALAETMQRLFLKENMYWHGPLWKHVADLSVEQALWRPAPDRHCIWEHLRHIHFWRQRVITRFSGGTVPDWRPYNWTLPDPADEAAWQADLADLEKVQEALVGLCKAVKAEDLLAGNGDNEETFRRFVILVGLLSHDSYHTGQIALLRALMGLPPIE